jgi:beta-galactosidase
VDIVKPGDDLSGYKLVLAPHLHVLPDKVANQLVDYVRNGGVLMADCRTGVKDETNLAYARTLPGLLSPALGIEIQEYESLALGISDKETTTYKIATDPSLGTDYTAILYADWIAPKGAKAMARYDQPHLKDFAAVTRNAFGKGVGWYVGTITQETAFYDKLIESLLKDASIRPIVSPPGGVEVSERQSPERRLVFLLNHTDSRKTVQVPTDRPELLSGTRTDGAIELDAFGVAIVELPADEGGRQK